MKIHLNYRLGVDIYLLCMVFINISLEMNDDALRYDDYHVDADRYRFQNSKIFFARKMSDLFFIFFLAIYRNCLFQVDATIKLRINQIYRFLTILNE